MNNSEISKKIQILINQFNVKNFDLVVSKGNILIKKNPNYVILYNIIGSAYQQIGDFINAKKKFKDGLKLEGNNIALMNNLAMTYKNLLEYKKAQDIYLKIISINKKYINAYVNLGNIKRDLNNFDEAIKLYKLALEIDTKNPIINYSLALAYQGLGDFKQTIYYAEKTLEIDINFTRADHLISQSTKYENNNSHYLSLKEKINKSKSESFEKIDLYFALAKAEEDLGDIKNASQFILKGNKIKKKLINYNVENEIRLMNDIKDKFNKIDLKSSLPKKNEKIIFILGMPRSGTSLVEQIITSHSKVIGGGELPILSNIVKNNFLINHESIISNFKDVINNQELIIQIKNEYLDFIENFNVGDKFITDKAPLNFRWIGFIKALLPNAKIIHCIREPKNNCLSMFKNLFEGGLNFTYDQDDLVSYYKNYIKLMSFWNSKFKESIYEVSYENLIHNNVDEIKKIINFCDLKWEENCLEFHNNKTPIKTMSTAQARKPIYKSSLNIFEKFKNYFTILDNEL